MLADFMDLLQDIFENVYIEENVINYHYSRASMLVSLHARVNRWTTSATISQSIRTTSTTISQSISFLI
jgi:hypothetical protein